MRILATIAYLWAGACAQNASLRKVEVNLDRNRGGKIEAVAPNQVFENGDLVRFRFNASFSGFLFVMNHATSGRYTALFPSEQTGTDNKISGNREYLIPATDGGWFRLEGPAGYETVYWVLTPVSLARTVATIPPPTEPLHPSITPRCDDAIFQARGECLDRLAGPKPLNNSGELPENLSSLKPRDLTVTKTDMKTALSAPAGEEAPFVYIFRLAHK